MVCHVPEALAGRRARVILFVALGVVFLSQSGCDGGAAARGPGKSATSRSAQVGTALPEIVPVTADQILAAVQEAGKPVLLNVWATWCRPCREEFPDLLRLDREGKVSLMLVSADFPDQLDQARAFLKDQGVSFPSFLKEGADMEFIDRLSPKWTGALPASFVFDRDGKLLDYWEGKASYEMMEKRVTAALAGARSQKRQEGEE